MSAAQSILGVFTLMCAVLVVAGVGARIGEYIEVHHDALIARLTRALGRQRLNRWEDRRPPGLRGRATLNALRVAQCLERIRKKSAYVRVRHDPHLIPAFLEKTDNSTIQN